MRGLIAARTAVMTAVVARRMTRASGACRRLMTIPGVGQLTALAFVAAIDHPSRIHRSRDVGAYLGLVPKRYQSGEVDYVGGISKCGDRRVRTLLYEAANVMLTRYKGQLKGLGVRDRQAIDDAQGARRSGSSSRDHHACHVARRNRVRTSLRGLSGKPRQETASSSRKERRPREGADNGANSVARGQPADCVFNLAALYAAYPIRRLRARREHRHPKASTAKEPRPWPTRLQTQSSY